MDLIKADESEWAGFNNDDELDLAFVQMFEENSIQGSFGAEHHTNSGDEESEEWDQGFVQMFEENTLDEMSNTGIQGNGDEEADISEDGDGIESENDEESDEDFDGESDSDSDGEPPLPNYVDWPSDSDESDTDNFGPSDDDSDGPSDSDSDEGSDSDSDGEHSEDGSESGGIIQTNQFCTLPCEIRLMVYGHLLRANGPILNKNRNRRSDDRPYMPIGKGQDLHPQVLATCRQIRSECGNMLYDDNTFHVTTEDFDRNFHQCRVDHCDINLGIQPPQIFQRMKRIELKVGGGLCIHYLGDAIETSGRILGQMPQLEYLRIQFTPGMAAMLKADRNRASFKESRVHTSMIEGLTLIRNIPRVEIKGFDSNWRNYLIKKMTSSSLIPKMYWALEVYANSIEAVPYNSRHGYRAVKPENKKAFAHRASDAMKVYLMLGWAYRAAGRDDLKTFMAKRQNVIKLVDRFMKRQTRHLFDQDAAQQQLQQQ